MSYFGVVMDIIIDAITLNAFIISPPVDTYISLINKLFLAQIDLIILMMNTIRKEVSGTNSDGRRKFMPKIRKNKFELVLNGLSV